MHKVMFRKDDKHRTLSMVACGHAGAGEKGKDIVCAGVSILACTLIQNVQYWYKMRMITQPHIEVDEQAGDVEIRIRARNQSDYAQVLNGFLVLSIGYVLMAHNYPKNVAVKTFNDTSDKARD